MLGYITGIVGEMRFDSGNNPPVKRKLMGAYE